MVFKLGRKVYSVCHVPDFGKAVTVARIRYGAQEIILANKCGATGIRRTKNQKLHSFWHEVTHGILDDMGSKLESNEAFVEAFSKRLVGVLKEVGTGEHLLVSQQPEAVRDMPKAVPRGARAQAVPAHPDRADDLRRGVARSG